MIAHVPLFPAQTIVIIGLLSQCEYSYSYCYLISFCKFEGCFIQSLIGLENFAVLVVLKLTSTDSAQK